MATTTTTTAGGKLSCDYLSMRFSRGVSQGIVSRREEDELLHLEDQKGMEWGRRSVGERSCWRDKEGARGGG